MKSTKTKATKKAATKGKTTKREPFTSASSAVEEIEEPAGETGRIAHVLFFTLNDFPVFIRRAIFDAMERASFTLALPNPNKTTDDRTAFQQMIDLFDAAAMGCIYRLRRRRRARTHSPPPKKSLTASRLTS